SRRRHTRFSRDWSSDVCSSDLNESKSYRFNGSWEVEPETDFTIPLGAGAIISTPTDVTKFADNLFAGKLLKPESVEVMKTINDRSEERRVGKECRTRGRRYDEQ